MKHQKIVALGTDLVMQKLKAKGIDIDYLEERKLRNILVIKSFKKEEHIRVLTRAGAKRYGQKGLPTLIWKARDTIQTDYIACVDFHTATAWLFSLLEFKNACQQYNKDGIYRLRMTTERPKRKPAKKSYIGDFDGFRI